MSKLGGSIVAVGLAFACVAGLYICDVYLPWQRINGKYTGITTHEQVATDLLASDAQFTVRYRDEDVVVPAVIDVEFDDNSLEQSPIDWLLGKELIVSPAYSVNLDKLAGYLNTLYKPMSDASIECLDGYWKLNKEVEGYQFNVESALSAIDNYYLDLDTLVQHPTITEKMLRDKYVNVEWLNDFVILYTNGVKIRGVDLSQFVTDYELLIPTDYLTSVVKSIAEFYSTTGGDLRFIDPVTNAITSVAKKTFGRSVNVSKEVDALNELIASHTSEYNRTPVMSGYDEFNGTYVVVSIEEQHLWYYKDGELIDETDVVTGRKGVHDTPLGAYYISECIPGKYLVGDTYKTWVNQWMRLTNSGIGLHDAYWRSSFGSTVYIGNGSHGCVNIPKDFAAMLYKESYVGMPVIIY